MLLRKVLEALHDDPGVVAVPHIDTGRAQPGLKVVYRERDVLRVGSVEHPDLPVGCGSGHAVAIVVEENPLVSRKRHSKNSKG